MNRKIVSITIVVLFVVVAASVAVVALSGSGDKEDSPAPVPEPETKKNPLDIGLSNLPIGSILKWEITGVYVYKGHLFDVVGEETYEVISKDSKNISFRVNGATYITQGSEKGVISKSNNDVKTWDLTDKHEPCEVGELDTEFGTQKVKIVVFNLPSESGGYKITDHGSKQYWGYDNGFGLLQVMHYSASNGYTMNMTKALVSVEPA